MNEEADDLVVVERYERIADRETCCIACWERELAIACVEVTIRMPMLSCMRFAATIIERQRPLETSAEESTIVMRLIVVLIWIIEIASESLRGARCYLDTT